MKKTKSLGTSPSYREVAKIGSGWDNNSLYKKGDKYYIFKSEEIPADGIMDVIKMLSDAAEKDPSAFLSYEYSYSDPYEPSERLHINYYDEVSPTSRKIQNIIKKLEMVK